jgi:hypothetical protein
MQHLTASSLLLVCSPGTDWLGCLWQNMPWRDVLGGFMNAFSRWLADTTAAIVDAVWFKSFMGMAAEGNLDSMCGGAPDCGTRDFASRLSPYAMLLGLVCWTYSILRQLYAYEGVGDTVSLGFVLHQVQRGLVMLLGVSLAYSLVLFGYEVSRAAGHAMFDDLGGYGQFPNVTANLAASPPPGLTVVAFVLAVIEWLFLAILMIASSVGALLAATFGPFCLAVTPASGLRGWAARWTSGVTALLLMRMFLPPIAAVLTHMLYAMQGSQQGTLQAAAGSISPLVFGIALLWVTGKAVGLLSEGVLTAAGSITGMAETAKQGAGVAAAVGGPVAKTADLAYRGTARALRAAVSGP